MADYPIIADVSAYIVRTLRQKMCPEPIPSPNNIEISSPASQDVDYILGLYLYDIREENDVTRNPVMGRGKLQLSVPPKPYSLYYMVFINGSSQMGLKAPDIQKIVGRVAQGKPLAYRRSDLAACAADAQKAAQKAWNAAEAVIL